MWTHYGARAKLIRAWIGMLFAFILQFSAIASGLDDQVFDDVSTNAIVRTLEVSQDARYYNADKHGLQFGGAVHALGADAASFVARGNHIFIPYYHEDFTVRLVRLDLQTGAKTEITFGQSKVPCGGRPELQDTHHNFAFEISDDGVMHLFFGHHRSRLRYLKSVAGAADAPDSGFNADLFPGPPQSLNDSMLHKNQDRHCNGVATREWAFLNQQDGVISPITYPRLSKSGGGLVLYFRQGMSPRMSSLFASRYEGNGQWSRRFKVIDGFLGTRNLPNGQVSSSRGPYMHGYGGQEVSHIAWTFREHDDRPYGIFYGKTTNNKDWNSQDGRLIARDNNGYRRDISLDVETNAATVDPDVTGVFMFVRVIEDSQNNPHITAYRFAGRVFGVNIWELIHYTPVQGVWQKTIIGNFTGQQPTLVPDPDNQDLYLVMNDHHNGVLNVQRAQMSDNWENWTTIYEGSPGYDSHGYARFVQGRLVIALQQEIISSDDDRSPYDLLVMEVPGKEFAMDR